MAFGYGLPVELLRETVIGTDEYGNDVLTAVSVRVDGCAIWPSDANGAGANERTAAADIVQSGYSVLMPPGTKVLATDRVRLPHDPTVWEINGLPVEWQSPFTSVRSGVRVILTAVR